MEWLAPQLQCKRIHVGCVGLDLRFQDSNFYVEMKLGATQGPIRKELTFQTSAGAIHQL